MNIFHVNIKEGWKYLHLGLNGFSDVGARCLRFTISDSRIVNPKSIEVPRAVYQASVLRGLDTNNLRDPFILYIERA